MSFVMDVARSARVKYLDEHGHEQLDDDDPYLFLRIEAAGPASAPQKRKATSKLADDDEGTGHESDDEVVNPGPALEALAAAQQQLVIMQDLIKNVQTLHTLSVHYVDAPRSVLQSLTAAAVAVESRKQDLRSASNRLRQAAKQMESETQQNNRFIECLSDLQAFWRIRSRSIRQETVFYASLVFPISMAPLQMIDGAEKPPDLPQLNIALRQGLQGAVIVTLAPETVMPTVQAHALGSANESSIATVAIGTHSVHSLLLERFHALVWAAVHQRCTWELQQVSHVRFTHKLVMRVLASIETSFDENNELSRFRPKLTQCMLTQMLPGPAASGVTVLVPKMLSVLKLTHVRNAVYATLRDQVLRYDCGQIVRLPFCSCNTAAFLLQASGSGSILVAATADDSGKCCITVHALPRGSSPVHTSPYFTEYTLRSSSMLILDGLVMRYWGRSS
eukprot:jgi/Ulvmu1/5123/UM021_0140.1